MDFETDDVTTIQTLLLISHYYHSMTEQRHTWFWVHQAIGLAQGIGLHKASESSPQRKLWARIWWCCLIRDRLIALGTNRPMHINSLDCSVPLPSADDLEERGDTEEDAKAKIIFADFVRLCQYMEGVLNLTLTPADSLGREIDVCRTALQHWFDNLSVISRRDTEEAPGHDVPTLYRCLLHLFYKYVDTHIILLHRLLLILVLTTSPA